MALFQSADISQLWPQRHHWYINIRITKQCLIPDMKALSEKTFEACSYHMLIGWPIKAWHDLYSLNWEPLNIATYQIQKLCAKWFLRQRLSKYFSNISIWQLITPTLEHEWHNLYTEPLGNSTYQQWKLSAKRFQSRFFFFFFYYKPMAADQLMTPRAWSILTPGAWLA